MLHTWRRPCVWLALAALVWACLAPQLARLSSGPQPPWMDVCTAMGTIVMQATGNGLPGTDDDGNKTVQPDCPFCRLQAASAPPPSQDRFLHPVRSRAAPPAPPRAAPATERPWRRDRARAPPSATQA